MRHLRLETSHLQVNTQIKTKTKTKTSEATKINNNGNHAHRLLLVTLLHNLYQVNQSHPDLPPWTIKLNRISPLRIQLKNRRRLCDKPVNLPSSDVKKKRPKRRQQEKNVFALNLKPWVL